MSFKVTVQPSNRTFQTQQHESLLDEAMREGLNLAHQCMSGSCGGCQALLLKGDITQIRHYDFKLPAAEADKQPFLVCCYQASSDLVIQMHEIDDVAEIPHQQIACKVSRIDQLNPDVFAVQLKTPRTQILEFLAGQRVDIKFAQHTLNLGIASCPCDGMNVRFHLDKKVTQQAQVLKSLRKGAKISIEGPTGQLTLNEGQNNPLVFMAFETGFAQIQSLVDHVISIDDDRPIYLVCLTRSSVGFYKENHCRAWRDVLDNFDYDIVYLPDQYHADFPLLLNRLTSKLFRFPDSEIYSVLPMDLITPLQNLCHEHDLNNEQLFVEAL